MRSQVHHNRTGSRLHQYAIARHLSQLVFKTIGHRDDREIGSTENGRQWPLGLGYPPLKKMQLWRHELVSGGGICFESCHVPRHNRVFAVSHSLGAGHWFGHWFGHCRRIIAAGSSPVAGTGDPFVTDHCGWSVGPRLWNFQSVILGSHIS